MRRVSKEGERVGGVPDGGKLGPEEAPGRRETAQLRRRIPEGGWRRGLRNTGGKPVAEARQKQPVT